MQKVKDFLTRDNWARHFQGRNAQGQACFYNEEQTVSWDLYGAIMLCYQGRPLEKIKAFEDVKAAAELLYPNLTEAHPDSLFSLNLFNDLSTFEDIQAVLELADI
jgi:hypothetical protein